MRHVFIGLVIGVILGVGITSTLLSPAPRAQQQIPTIESMPLQQAGATDLAKLQPADASPSRSAAPKREALEPSLSNEQLAETVHSPPKEQKKTDAGPGAIRGRALDTDGRAIAGVLVRAQRWADRRQRASAPSTVGVMPEPASLERHLREAAREYAAGRSRSYEVMTDTRGEFILEGLPEGGYQISTFAEGYILRERGSEAGPFESETDDVIELIGEAILAVEVSVVRADGTEVDQAIVRCSDLPIRSKDDWSESLFGHGRNDFTWSPNSSRLRLPAKTVHLKAFVNPSSSGPVTEPDDADFHSASIEVRLSPGTEPAKVLLPVEIRPGIRGRVLFPEERLPDTVAAAHLLALPRSGEVDLEALAYADPTVRLRRGDAQFSFLDIPPGRYAVGVNRNWGAPIDVYQVVKVDEGIIDCELKLPPPNPDKLIRVKLLHPDGSAVNDASFSFTYRSGGGSSSTSAVAPIKTSDGVFHFSLPAEHMKAYYVEPTAGDEFILSAHAAGYGLRDALLRPGQQSVSIQFTEQAFFKVSVLGVEETGLEGRLELFLRALLDESKGTHLSSYGESVSRDGQARFDGLTAQRYQLTLRTQWRHNSFGDYQSSTDLVTTEVNLQPGANMIEISIPPIYTLEVLLEGTQEIRNITLKSISSETGEVLGAIASQNTDDSGRALFNQLTAGRYRVEAQGAERLEAFTVPCGPVTLRVQR